MQARRVLHSCPHVVPLRSTPSSTTPGGPGVIPPLHLGDASGSVRQRKGAATARKRAARRRPPAPRRPAPLPSRSAAPSRPSWPHQGDVRPVGGGGALDAEQDVDGGDLVLTGVLTHLTGPDGRGIDDRRASFAERFLAHGPDRSDARPRNVRRNGTGTPQQHPGRNFSAVIENPPTTDRVLDVGFDDRVSAPRTALYGLQHLLASPASGSSPSSSGRPCRWAGPGEPHRAGVLLHDRPRHRPAVDPPVAPAHRPGPHGGLHGGAHHGRGVVRPRRRLRVDDGGRGGVPAPDDPCRPHRVFGHLTRLAAHPLVFGTLFVIIGAQLASIGLPHWFGTAGPPGSGGTASGSRPPPSGPWSCAWSSAGRRW